MEIGDKIRSLREEKGLTLEQLGNLVGVGKSTVRKWETGQIANMRRDKIQRLAEALGVSPLDIIGVESNSAFLFSANDTLGRYAYLLSIEQAKEVRELFSDALRANNLSSAFVTSAAGAKRDFISKLLKNENCVFKLPLVDAFSCAAYLGIAEALLVCLDKPAPEIESELDAELIRLLLQLTPEEDQKVLAFVQGLIANRKA